MAVRGTDRSNQIGRDSEAVGRPSAPRPVAARMHQARRNSTPAVPPTSRTGVRQRSGRCRPCPFPHLEAPVRRHDRPLAVAADLRIEGHRRRPRRPLRMATVLGRWPLRGAVRRVRSVPKVRRGREVDIFIIQKMSEAHRGSRTVRRSMKSSSKSTAGNASEFTYRTRSVRAPARLAARPTASGPGRHRVLLHRRCRPPQKRRSFSDRRLRVPGSSENPCAGPAPGPKR